MTHSDGPVPLQGRLFNGTVFYRGPDGSRLFTSDQNGTTVKLSDFRGKKVLLYFYPKAETPGCTTQSCAVRERART